MKTEYYRLEAGRFKSRLKDRLRVFNFEFFIFFCNILGFYVFHYHFISDVTGTCNEKATRPQMPAPALSLQMAIFL